MQTRRDFLAAMALGATGAALAPKAWADGAAAPAALRFKEGKPFRILQLTDFHYIPPTGKDKRGQQVDDLLAKVLPEDRPDLAIVTGDCVTNSRMEEGWTRLADIFGRFKVPFAAVMGNHDHEGRHTRKAIVDFVSGLPGSLTRPGPADLPGCGNYTLPILPPEGDAPRFMLYLLDSRAYAAETPLKAVKGIGKYAWFAPTQVAWFRAQAAAFRKANGGEPLPGAAFFHIPLPEYDLAWAKGDGKPVGAKNEAVCCPKVNTGMFYAFLEARGILAAFCGHDHDNDYAACLNGVGLVYGRFSGGTNTYRHWENGARIIDIAPDGRALRTRTHLLSGKYGPVAHYAL